MNTTGLQQGATELPANAAEQYERDGFLVVPDVFTREECQQLKTEGLRVLNERAGKNQSVFVGVATASKKFYELASDPRLVEILRPIMPGGIMFISDKFVWKSGEQRVGTPWHCDIAYWRDTRPKLSIWIALDDVTAANGALKVLPGGHKQQWEHGTLSNVEFNNRISELPETPPGEVVCEIAAGSLIVFSDMLPHASTPNTAGVDRYAIISTYHAPASDDFFDVQFSARHVIVPAPGEAAA